MTQFSACTPASKVADDWRSFDNTASSISIETLDLARPFLSHKDGAIIVDVTSETGAHRGKSSERSPSDAGAVDAGRGAGDHVTFDFELVVAETLTYIIRAPVILLGAGAGPLTLSTLGGDLRRVDACRENGRTTLHREAERSGRVTRSQSGLPPTAPDLIGGRGRASGTRCRPSRGVAARRTRRRPADEGEYTRLLT